MVLHNQTALPKLDDYETTKLYSNPAYCSSPSDQMLGSIVSKRRLLGSALSMTNRGDVLCSPVGTFIDHENPQDTNSSIRIKRTGTKRIEKKPLEARPLSDLSDVLTYRELPRISRLDADEESPTRDDDHKTVIVSDYRKVDELY